MAFMQTIRAGAGSFDAPRPGRKAWIIIGWIVAIVVAVTFLSPIAIVPAGHRGVITTFGKVDRVVLGEGIHFRMPIAQRVHLLTTQIQKSEGRGQAASRDLQQVETTVALNWSIDPARAPEIFQEIGTPEAVAQRIIEPSGHEAVKAVTARYTAEELITKRSEVRNSIRELLAERLGKYGVKVEEFSIVNFDFSKAFDQAIEAKVTAEQRKLQAERDLERIRVEAEQKLAMARAEAESLRIQKQEVTPQMIELRRIENERLAISKWDGKLPQMTGGTVPFVNLGQPPLTR